MSITRNKDWYNHAERCLRDIKEFRQASPLGYFTSPNEYLSTLEDFVKLFYGINKVPGDVVDRFKKSKNLYNAFKESISILCEKLLKEAEKITNEEKNERKH